MNIDDFAKWARHRGEPVRVDEISIATQEGTFSGRGSLRAGEDKFLLKVTLDGAAKLPTISGTYTRDQFWKISGRIEEKLPFHTVGISAKRFTHTGHFLVEQTEIDLDHISFVTEETRKRDDELRSLLAPDREPRSSAGYWGRAYLEGHKPVSMNGGTSKTTTNDFLGKSSSESLDTFAGEFGDLEYAIIKVGTDSEAYLRTKKDSIVTEQVFRDTFDAFLKAVAFVHGREAWPQHFTITSGVDTLHEEVRPSRELPSTPWRLLNERACIVNRADLGVAVTSAMRFFLVAGPLQEAVKRALLLSRQSSLQDAPLDVGTLSLCSVFEGLVNKLHKILAEPAPTPDIAAFGAAKDELLAYARQRDKEGAPGFTRLIGLLTGAKPYRVKDSFPWLVDHLGLRWEPEMKEAFDAWNDERNALAHGSEVSDGWGDRVTNQSRLAGAINIIVARLMGYSGPAIFSAVEDRIVDVGVRSEAPTDSAESGSGNPAAV